MTPEFTQQKSKSVASSAASELQSSCPIPLQQYPNIVMGHGSGGKLSNDLVRHVFAPAFGIDHSVGLRDSALLTIGGQRLAFSSDSFVVNPLVFPGGSIGDLAVNGTVNDLAMSGAVPLYLSTAFIIEEGFSLAELQAIVDDVARAAERASVQIVGGDTKVVERGHGHSCYINTSGIGVVAAGVEIGTPRIEPGDAVIISGTIGDHGMSIMSVREGLQFQSEIRSDTAPLNNLVQAMLAACPEIHMLRDPTRGGVNATLNEVATACNLGIVIDEESLPISSVVQSACDVLGIDPLMVANEGKLIAFVPQQQAAAVVEAMKSVSEGQEATIIGRVTDDHPGIVVATTAIGAKRVVTMPVNEQLPRIC